MRSIEFEEIYPDADECGREARARLEVYFRFYNVLRSHQALGYETSAEVYNQPARLGAEPSTVGLYRIDWHPSLSFALILSN